MLFLQSAAFQKRKHVAKFKSSKSCDKLFWLISTFSSILSLVFRWKAKKIGESLLKVRTSGHFVSSPVIHGYVQFAGDADGKTWRYRPPGERSEKCFCIKSLCRKNVSQRAQQQGHWWGVCLCARKVFNMHDDEEEWKQVSSWYNHLSSPPPSSCFPFDLCEYKSHILWMFVSAAHRPAAVYIRHDLVAKRIKKTLLGSRNWR